MAINAEFIIQLDLGKSFEEVIVLVRFEDGDILDKLKDCDEDCLLSMDELFDNFKVIIEDEYGYEDPVIDDIDFGEEVDDLEPDGIDLFVGSQDWLESEDNGSRENVLIVGY